jgi:prevent-host-death family protein
MTTITINTVDAKEQFADLVNQVAQNKDLVILTRRDKEIAAIIPIEDLKLLLASQSKHDLRDATESLKEARENYHVKIAPLAVRQIKNLSIKHRKLVIKLIEALAINPRPPGAKKIEGMTGLYSENIDHLRLIYKIEDEEVLLLLVK